MNICTYICGCPCPSGACTPSSDDLATQLHLEPQGRERVGVIPGSHPPASCSSPFSPLPGSCRTVQRRYTEVFLQISSVVNSQIFISLFKSPGNPYPHQMHTRARAHTPAWGYPSAQEGRKRRRNTRCGPGICWVSEVGKCHINHAIGQQKCNRGGDLFGDSSSVCRSIHITGLAAWATEGRRWGWVFWDPRCESIAHGRWDG